MVDPASSPFQQHSDGYYNCLTAAQESALQELRLRLPSALGGFTPEELTLWGVELASLVPASLDASKAANADSEPANGTIKDADKPSRIQTVVLLKFLRARQFHVQAALNMLVKCLKWRRDFDVPGLSLETFPPALAAAGQLSGRDRAGNPVTYNYYGREVDLESVLSSPGGVATFVRWRVRLMEQAVGLLDFERSIEHVTQVHDYSGASLFRMDSHIKAATKEIIKLFQDNYPEMLSVKLFLNVPRFMEFMFGLFSTFSDPATRAKFHMVSPARARTAVLQFIDPVQLPSRFGGFLETCSVPPGRGRPTAFMGSSKLVVLMPGESHVTSEMGGTESEVVWGFCSTGAQLGASILFRPRDNGEAAAVAARQPDHIPGVGNFNSRYQDALYVTESHRITLTKDTGSGRLVLGCPGEVILTIENTNRSGGFFSHSQPITVHYVLMAATQEPPGQVGPPSVGSSTDNLNTLRMYGEGFPAHPLDWRTRVASYRSFGQCSSFASHDPGPEGSVVDASGPPSPRRSGQLQLLHSGPATAAPVATQVPPLPPLRSLMAGTVGGTSIRIATVPEVDERESVTAAGASATSRASAALLDNTR